MLDKDTLLNNINDILHICVNSVHTEMMKKLMGNQNNLKTTGSQSSYAIIKSLNIRQSSRKKNLIEQDSLLKIDMHSLFVESFKVNIFFEF